MPTITGFHHISLTVSDAAKSEEFYTNVFGFVGVLDLPDEGGRGLKRVLAHPESRTILGFSVHGSNDGSPFTEFRMGLDHLSFGVPSRAELDAWLARFDELGIEHSGVTTTPVGDLVTVRDPDNIQVELWANPA
jgi:catechol 2,3-dioxygenase-like lactoylglutathione lyase family enzyme